MKRIIGIGNALTDMLISLSGDEVLSQYQLDKGSMSLVDNQFQTDILKAVAGLPHSLSLGGSAGNTIRTMARLGTEVGFIGKVGEDSTGDFYIQALRNVGVEPFILRSEHSSGKCLSLISADGERTLVTHLGAAADLQAEDIDAAVFDGYDALYIEGYLVQDHDLIRTTMARAKQHGLKVAIDLASFNVVRENREFLHDLVERYVDIIFANEEEAYEFSGCRDAMEALLYIGKMCELTVVKTGIRGALIKRGDEIVEVGIMAAAKRVDTTGAGDFYAAGFLTALCEGLSLRQCGTIGAITAGKVIEVVGTTLSEETWNEIETLIERVRCEQYLF
ncbi:MAG: adenosine kinase [Alistipes sp.]|nr:adenosine kinase [Alistipes sp.]MEE1148898.1 adenosine kinase [Alistipes sp.]